MKRLSIVAMALLVAALPGAARADGPENSGGGVTVPPQSWWGYLVPPIDQEVQVWPSGAFVGACYPNTNACYGFATGPAGSPTTIYDDGVTYGYTLPGVWIAEPPAIGVGITGQPDVRVNPAPGGGPSAPSVGPGDPFGDWCLRTGNGGTSC